MRKAKVYMHGNYAGLLLEIEKGHSYRFSYDEEYSGPPVSLTMSIDNRIYNYRGFPPFFEGLLPEGIMLEGLLRQLKIDRNDYFAQLVATGEDLVGAATVQAVKDE